MATPVTTGIKNEMYNKQLYHLDLCILSYHLYHQSLIWPWDPYYEQSSVAQYRDTFMGSVSSFAAGTDSLNGPGSCKSWPSNLNLDPILTDYNQLNPWKSAFVQPEPDQWLLSQPPTFITDKIKKVFVSKYNSSPYGTPTPKYFATPQDAINLLSNTTISEIDKPSITQPGDPASATDMLYCFEGGTGAVRTRRFVSNPQISFHAWSLMGFVLCRDRGTGLGYDVHIVFRGSRSGSGGRAAKQALVEKGNSDWVTDMDAFSSTNYPIIGPEGNMSMGFSESMLYTLPNILKCLDKINKDKKSAPQNIYVTGHSLGGALATMCASALAVGVNPKNTKLITNNILKDWPLDSIQLITYSAPTVGSDNFVSFTNTAILPIRVHVSGDPITSDNAKGRHVGANLCLPNPGTVPSTHNHEPMTVRTQLLKFLKKSKVIIPADHSCLPTFTKCPTFYDLIKESPNAFVGEGATKYVSEYQELFDQLIYKNSTKNSKLVTDFKDTVNLKIKLLSASEISGLCQEWNNWVKKIKEDKKMGEAGNVIYLLGTIALIEVYISSKKEKISLATYFVSFAAALFQTPAYGSRFAKSKPDVSDFSQ